MGVIISRIRDYWAPIVSTEVEVYDSIDSFGHWLTPETKDPSDQDIFEIVGNRDLAVVLRIASSSSRAIVIEERYEGYTYSQQSYLATANKAGLWLALYVDEDYDIRRPDMLCSRNTTNELADLHDRFTDICSMALDVGF